MNDYLIQFALLRERVFREPNNRDLFRQLLICTELAGNYADCRDLYTAVLDEHPYCSYAWYNLGWVYAQLDEPEEALEAFEYAYITQPYFEDAYRACAELAVQRGLHQRALQCYTEMREYAGADGDILVRMAECLQLLGDTSRAKKMCRLALKIDSQNAEAFYQLGACFVEESDYAQAARYLRLAIRLKNQRDDVHSLLALAYSHLGKSKQALNHFWKAVELAPEDPPGWLRLAEFLLFAGKLDEAAEVLEQALENASNAELLYCCAACQFLCGQRNLAVQTLQQAMAVDVSRRSDIFRWAPALRDDAEVLGLLNSYT